MLFLVPTPIGNLKDITLRALDVLKECDYVLCEDTRKTGLLLHHFEIKKKLVSFYKEKEKLLEDSILEDLKSGKNICLVSDAGTPAINDPGTSLIAACHDNDIKVNSLPGPCSIPTALSLSGLTFNRFQFLGFFPKKEKERKELIEEMLNYDGVSIFFESPKRIIKSIKLFPEEVEVFVAKELSKIHERLLKVNSCNVLDFEDVLTRGEICVLVKGTCSDAPLMEMEDEKLMTLLTKHLSQRDAVKVASDLTGKKKQNFYIS